MPFDLTNAWPFTDVTLTETVNEINNTYGLIDELGWSPSEGVSTTAIEIAITGDEIRVLPNMPRGGVSATSTPQTERSEFIGLPFFPVKKTLTAADIQDWVKKAARQIKPKTMEESLAEYMLKRRFEHDQTLEYIRVGALKGLIKDGNGSTLLDIFTAFGVTKKQINFALGTATTNVRAKCAEVIRHIQDNLNGETMTGVEALVDSTFFDALISHAEVEKFYVNWQIAEQAANMSTSRYGRSFYFGNIMWREYNGAVTLYDGSTDKLIATGFGHATPVGTRDANQTYFGPADSISMANESGVDIYVTQKELDHEEGIEIKTQSAPLSVFRRPKMLVELLQN